MNWYKQSKLIDKDPSRKKIHSICQYCQRWATHPIKSSPEYEEYEWKKAEQLNPEEKQEMNEALKYNSNDIGISHGVCSYCINLINKIGFPETRKEINNLITKSLSINKNEI